MSSGPQTIVDAGMYRTGAAPKAGYTNENDGATPLCHVGIFSRACSDCHFSLLISLRTRRDMPLTEWLERGGGLFLDSASTLFFGGGRSGSRELPEDNLSFAAASLSYGRIGSLSLFCLTGVQGACSLERFHPDLLPDEPTGDRSLVADGQHSSATQPYVLPVLPVSSLYPDANEGTDLLGC